MFRIKLSKMAYEINDLKGILILVLVAIPMIASNNINCHGKAFHCVNSTHFMICVDLGGGVSSTIDDFVIPCPDTTVCHEENTFECDFPDIEVVPPLQVLGVHKQSDTREMSLVTDSVTTPMPTSDTFSDFMENVTATTLPIPEVVTTVMIMDEHIQQATQIDIGNTTDTSFPVISSFVNNTNDGQLDNNTILTLITDYPGNDTTVKTSTDKVPDPSQDQSKLLDSTSSIRGAIDLIPVLPVNVTTTTSLPNVSTLNYLNANISPTSYQNKTRQDSNADNMTKAFNNVPGEAKSNSTIENNNPSYLASTEIVNISDSVTEGVQKTTDMSNLGLVDLIAGPPNIHITVNTMNNSNFDKNVGIMDSYLTRQDTNDSGNAIFSEAATPKETILTEVLISTDQISTTPSIKLNSEGFNNTDINYNSVMEFNFTDQITTTENVSEMNPKNFDLERKTIPGTQPNTGINFVPTTAKNLTYEGSTIPTFEDVLKNDSFVEVSTTVDQPMEIISTTDLSIVFNNNLSENNASDVINSTQTIKAQYGDLSTESSFLLSTDAIEVSPAEKPPVVVQTEVSAHFKKILKESSSTEGPRIIINATRKDIEEINTILPFNSTTVPNSDPENNTKLSTQFTEITNNYKLPVPDIPTIVMESKQHIVQNSTVVTINRTEALNANDVSKNAGAVSNSTFSAQFTEATIKSPVIDNPHIVNELKHEVVHNNNVLGTNATTTQHDETTIPVSEVLNDSKFSGQFAEVTNKPPVEEYTNSVNKPKQGFVENNTFVTNNPIEALNELRANSVTEAIDTSMFSVQFTEVIDKSQTTDKPKIVNEPIQGTVQNNNVLTINTTTHNHERIMLVTEALGNSTFSAQFAETTNKPPVTESPKNVYEPKQGPIENNTAVTNNRTNALNVVRINTVTEELDNSKFSGQLPEVTIEARGTDNRNIEPKQETVQNNNVLKINTTAHIDERIILVTAALDNSTFPAQFAEVTNKPSVAEYTHYVNKPKQGSIENNSVVTNNRTNALNVVRINTVTEEIDNSMFSGQLPEVTIKSRGTDNRNIEPKQETVQNNNVLKINTTAHIDESIILVTEALDNSTFPAQFAEVTNKPPVAEYTHNVNEPKQGTVENNIVVTNNTTDALNDVRINTVTEAIDNSMFSTQLTEVTNKSRGTDNRNIELKQETVQNNNVPAINTTAHIDESINLVTAALNNSNFPAQFAEVTNKPPVTEYTNTVNEPTQGIVEKRLSSVTEVIHNTMVSANVTKVTNEPSLVTSSYNNVNEPKQEIVKNGAIYTTTANDVMKEMTETEATDNSKFSAHLIGAINDAPVANYLSVESVPKREVANKSKLITNQSTSAPGIAKKNSIIETINNSAFFTGVTNDSSGTAYSDFVNVPKQETVEINTVLSVYTTAPTNDIRTNSVPGAKNNSILAEHFTKGTTESSVTTYPNTVNEPKQNYANDKLLTNNIITTVNILNKGSVTEAIDNSAFPKNFTGETTESPVIAYPYIVNGSKQESEVKKTLHSVVIDNSALAAVFPSTVNNPKQENFKNSAFSPTYTTSTNVNVHTKFGTEPTVKDLTTASDLVASEPAELITENNTRIDHVTASAGLNNHENITTDFTKSPKNLETATLRELSSANEWVDTVQDAVDVTSANTNNLQNSVNKLFPLNLMGINKTNNIESINKDIGTAPDTAINMDGLSLISLAKMPPSKRFVGEPTSSRPDAVDTIPSKDAIKPYEQLLIDGPPKSDINVHSRTEYIPETSTAFAIDGTDYTNIQKISSFGVTTKEPPGATPKWYTQSQITSVTTETAFSSLGTSVDWNASDSTDKINAETRIVSASEMHKNNIVSKTDIEPIRNTTNKIASPIVINSIDKNIKIVSESDFENSSVAIPNRKLEASNSNPVSNDYIKPTNPQDLAVYNTTADYIYFYNSTQVEQPGTKTFESLQQNSTTTVDLLKSITKTDTLPMVEEISKRVSGTEASISSNIQTEFKRTSPIKPDFNYVTEKLTVYVSSQEPILTKLNRIPKVDSPTSKNSLMASTTILPNTLKTALINDKDKLNDASVFIQSSTPPVPVKNNLKINKELPILSLKPMETKTTEYYSEKPVLPITEVPLVKITTDASQPSKILTQTTFNTNNVANVGEINKDLSVVKTTDVPKLMIPMENNKFIRSLKGKTTEMVNLITEPDSMVETIKVEAGKIPSTIESYTLTDNNSNNGVQVGKNKIDHQSIVIGNVYKNNGPTKTTDPKLTVDKVETLNRETDSIKPNIDVDIVKINQTSVEEDSSKSSVFTSKSGTQIKSFLPTTTADVPKPNISQTANFNQIKSVTITPNVVTQIESTVSKKPELLPMTKEKDTNVNASIRANDKPSDGKSPFQEALKNTTDMNNAKVNVTPPYHKLSLQNNTFNDELAEHLISTNHTITTEVQNHFNESDKQGNKTSYAVTSNITRTNNLNITALKINSGDKGNSSISVSTPQSFSCSNRTRGKYSDKKDCRKFYTCIGNLQAMIGTCPNNTVFSEINKQCTRNLSHCIRNNQFRCLLEGRFSDFFKDNIYYICVKNNSHGFIRYKLKCQSGYHLNKATVKCEKDKEISTQSASSVSEANNEESTTVKIKSDKITKTGFECESEGKFPYDKDCKKYYVCTKIKNGYQWKIKKCASGELYDKKKKKCVDSDSAEC